MITFNGKEIKAGDQVTIEVKRSDDFGGDPYWTARGAAYSVGDHLYLAHESLEWTGFKHNVRIMDHTPKPESFYCNQPDTRKPVMGDIVFEDGANPGEPERLVVGLETTGRVHTQAMVVGDFGTAWLREGTDKWFGPGELVLLEQCGKCVTNGTEHGNDRLADC